MSYTSPLAFTPPHHSNLSHVTPATAVVASSPHQTTAFSPTLLCCCTRYTALYLMIFGHNIFESKYCYFKGKLISLPCFEKYRMLRKTMTCGLFLNGYTHNMNCSCVWYYSNKTCFPLSKGCLDIPISTSVK